MTKKECIEIISNYGGTVLEENKFIWYPYEQDDSIREAIKTLCNDYGFDISRRVTSI